MVPSDDAGSSTPSGAGTDAGAPDEHAAERRGAADDRTADDRPPSGRAGPTPYLAGAVGGLVGAAAFGALMWLVNPEFLRSSIPAFYGLEPRGLLGWSVHLLHGVVLGLVFGAIVSRDVAREALIPADAEDLGPTGVGLRLVGAGVAYGIAVWALIPVFVLPAVSQSGGADRWGILSISGVESLAGHAVFGLVLGLVYAALVARA